MFHTFLFRPESPIALRKAGDDLGSPDGLRAYFGGKRETEDAAESNNAVRMKKKRLSGASSGRRLEMLLALDKYARVDIFTMR
jgi:hypothetical protein